MTTVLHALVVVAAGLAATLGGGWLIPAVMRRIDGGEKTDTITGAAEQLRGGRWIGLLERAAAFSAIVAGWPEGLALILAIKGLGRYPELHNHKEKPAVAERFIIGTLLSALWACALAGLALWLLDLLP